SVDAGPGRDADPGQRNIAGRVDRLRVLARDADEANVVLRDALVRVGLRLIDLKLRDAVLVSVLLVDVDAHGPRERERVALVEGARDLLGDRPPRHGAVPFGLLVDLPGVV